MKKITASFPTVAIVAIIAIAGFFLMREVMGLVRDARADLREISGNLNLTLKRAAAAAEQAREASVQANLAAAEQRAYWAKTSLETYKTMASLRLTIVRTDHSINDELVPKFSKALTDTDTLTNTAAQQLVSTMAQLRPTLDSLAQASTAAANAMSDPAIHATLTHMDETSASAADTAAQTAKIAAHLEASASDFEAFVHRITTPVRGTWNVVKTFLREFAGPAAQVATAVK